MSPIIAFFLGLLAGGVAERIIDWAVARQRPQRSPASEQAQSTRGAEQRVPQPLNPAVPVTSAIPGLEELQQEAPLMVEPEPSLAEAEAPRPPVPDNLEAIRGIGPVIARQLNQAGIYTFEQLGAQTPEGLRAILGDAIQRLADEESLITQARELAKNKQA